MVYGIILPKLRDNFSKTQPIASNAHQYVCFQWQKTEIPTVWFMSYRIIMAIVTSTIMISSIYHNSITDPDSSPFKWLIYMTHWGYMLIVLQFILSSFIVAKTVYQYIECDDTNTIVCSKIHYFYRIIHTKSAVLAFGITILYWTLIFDPSMHTLNANNYLVHGMNSVIMLIDLTLVAHSIRYADLIYAVIFAVVYAFFTYIYYLLGGIGRLGQPDIYPILNWRKPYRSLGVVFGAMVLLVIIFTITYLYVCFRQFIATRLIGYKINQIKSPSMTSDKYRPAITATNPQTISDLV